MRYEISGGCCLHSLKLSPVFWQIFKGHQMASIEWFMERPGFSISWERVQIDGTKKFKFVKKKSEKEKS